MSAATGDSAAAGEAEAESEPEPESASDPESEPDSGRDRDWASIPALVVLTVVLTLVADSSGTAAGLAAAVAWYVAGTPYAIAAGYVVLATTGPTATAAAMEPRTVGAVALAFLALVLAPIARSDRPLTDAAVALASAGGLVGTAWYVARSQPLWIAAGTVLGLGALAAYALHRYELVRLGLVPEPDAHSDT